MGDSLYIVLNGGERMGFFHKLRCNGVSFEDKSKLLCCKSWCQTPYPAAALKRRLKSQRIHKYGMVVRQSETPHATTLDFAIAQELRSPRGGRIFAVSHRIPHHGVLFVAQDMNATLELLKKPHMQMITAKLNRALHGTSRLPSPRVPDT